MTDNNNFEGKPKKKSINHKLWKKIQEQTRGSDEEKIEALDTIITRFRELPDEAGEILITISKTGSIQIKRKLANMIASKPSIPSALCLELFHNLEKEDDPQINKDLGALVQPCKELGESFKAWQKQVNKFFPKELFAQIEMQQALFQKALAPIEEVQQSIDKLLSFNFPSEQFRKSVEMLDQIRLPNVQLPSHVLDSINTFSRYHDLAYGNIARSSPSYYSPDERPETVQELEHPLILQIKELPPGHGTWSEYQQLCEAILTFCFVPPLLEPTCEKATEDGIHRRDIIYHLPHDTSGFWAYIKTAYNSLSIIVDAKNYSNILPKDQIVITSKYFGSKKLGSFGIIVCRKGLNFSGVKQQGDRWTHHDEMIVCLTDDDLIEMIKLKLADEDPAHVIDKKIRELRSSL